MVLPTTNSPDQCRGEKFLDLDDDPTDGGPTYEEMRCSAAVAAAARDQGWLTGSSLGNGTAAVLAGAQPSELLSTALRVNVGVQLRFF